MPGAGSLARRLSLSLASLLATGCFSTATLDRSALQDLSHRRVDSGAMLLPVAEDGSEVRLDPTSVVRLRLRDGKESDWYAADALSTSSRGVFVEEDVRLLSAIESARVAGLDKDARALLAEARPQGGELHAVDERTLELRITGSFIGPWLREFIRRTELRHAPLVDGAPLCRDPLFKSAGPCGFIAPDIYEKCLREASSAHECDPAREILQTKRAQEVFARRYRVVHELRGQPLGTWTFTLLDGRALAGKRGDDLYDLLEPSSVVRLRKGFSWPEVAAIDVNNFSGSKTLGAIAGTLGMAILFAPIGLAGQGVGTIQGWTGSSSVSGGSGVGGALPIGGGPDIEPRLPIPSAITEPSLEGRAAVGSAPLFTSLAKRRAVISMLVSTDAYADPIAQDALLGGFFAGMRLYQSFELGGGVRSCLGNAFIDGGPRLATGLLGFGRIGGHFHLDDEHRFAIPLGVEVGGGAPGFFFRLELGLRVRLTEELFTGVYVLNPTYLSGSAHSPSGASGGALWSTGLEVGAAL